MRQYVDLVENLFKEEDTTKVGKALAYLEDAQANPSRVTLELESTQFMGTLTGFKNINIDEGRIVFKDYFVVDREAFNKGFKMYKLDKDGKECIVIDLETDNATKIKIVIEQ